jgi:acyl-CoA thioester hydrolase
MTNAATSAPPSPFTLLLRVRYGECDAQHVVFNARYGDYADIAMNEFLRALVGGYDKLLAAGMDTQVVRLVTDFRSPARFDEVLAVSVETASIGNTSFALTMQMALHPSGRQVATTTATYVLVTARTHQKMRVPDDMRALLQVGAPGAVVNHAGLIAGT